jgi:hypothetical protein
VPTCGWILAKRKPIRAISGRSGLRSLGPPNHKGRSGALPVTFGGNHANKSATHGSTSKSKAKVVVPKPRRHAAKAFGRLSARKSVRADGSSSTTVTRPAPVDRNLTARPHK